MTTLKAKSVKSKKSSSRKSTKERKQDEYVFRGEYKYKDGAALRYVSPDITHIVVMVGTTRLVYDANRIKLNMLNNGTFRMMMEFVNTKKGMINRWDKEMILKDLKINPFRKTVRVVLKEYNYDNGRMVRIVNDIPFVIHMTNKGWEKLIGVLKELWYNENKRRLGVA